MNISFCVSAGRSKKVSELGACSVLPAPGASMGSADPMAAEAVGDVELDSILSGSGHCSQGPLLGKMAMGVVFLPRACFNDGIVWVF